MQKNNARDFYTAITRAKKILKLYWSSETMQAVIAGFQNSAQRQEVLNISSRNWESSNFKRKGTVWVKMLYIFTQTVSTIPP